MNLIRSTWNSWNKFSIEGAFDLRELSIHRDAFEEAKTIPGGKVILDLSATTMVDSSAIAIIISFHRAAIERSGRFVVVGINDDILDVFTITGLHNLVTIFRTMDEFERSDSANP